MAGAGGMTAANYLFNVAPKDGSVFGVLSRGLPMQPYLDPRGVQYDTRQFTWLGSPASEVSMVWCWHTAPFYSFEDLRRQEMILPATGTGADSVVFPFVMNAILGTRFKVVQGYPGSPELFMAVERGEAQGVASTSWNNFATTKQDWVREGKVRFLLQLGLKKLPDFPDLPLILDLADNESDKKALELVFSRNALAYPFVAPPGMAPDRAKALQAAFDQTVADPEVKQEALRQNLAWDPISSGEMTSLMNQLTDTPPQVLDRVKQALAEGEKASMRK
jgi:tripartite-type tricarboxylate transporter receptor subunit TctC